MPKPSRDIGPRDLRTKPKFLTDESPVSWDQFLGMTPPPTVNWPSVAFSLATRGHATYGFLDHSFDVNGVNPFTVGAAMMYALSRCDGKASPQTFGAMRREESVLADQLLRHAKRISSTGLRSADGTTSLGRSTIRARAVPMIACLHAAQQNPMLGWARARYLLGCSALAPDPEVRDEADSYMRDLVGCDLKTAVAVITAILAHVCHHPSIDMEASAKGLKERPHIAEAGRRFLESVSLPVDSVRHVAAVQFKDVDDLAPRVFRFWQSYPFIHLGGPHFLAGPPQILVGELGLGLLFRLMERARGAGASGDPRTSFSELLGRRFESYLTTLLRGTADRHDIEPEHLFHVKENYKSADISLFDRGDNVVTLFQVKLRRLSAQAFFGEDSSSLEDDLAKRVAEPIGQSISYLWRLDRAAKSNSIRPDSGDVSLRLLRSKNIVLVAAVLSLPFPLTSQDFRALVWVGVEEYLRSKSPELLGWFASFRRTRTVEWGVLDAEDIEYLAGWQSTRRIGRTLLRFFRESGKLSAFHRDGLLGGLQSYLRELTGSPPTRPQLVEDLVRDQMQEAQELALGSEKPGPPTGS